MISPPNGVLKLQKGSISCKTPDILNSGLAFAFVAGDIMDVSLVGQI